MNGHDGDEEIIAFDSKNEFLAKIKSSKVNQPLAMKDGTVHKKVWQRGGCVFLQNKYNKRYYVLKRPKNDP